MAAPILVTGSHRSGTTWTGRVLSLSPGVGYMHEPFNVHRWPNWMKRPFPYVFMYICEENESEYAALLEDVVGFHYPVLNIAAAESRRQVLQVLAEWPWSLFYRFQGARPLMKDPLALMSSEWLADRFGMQVVIMIRHPAAFVGSVKRLNWRFDFENWRDQPLLIRDLIGPYEAEIADYAAREHDIIDQAVVMWNVTHHVIKRFRERRPDWSFVRHEDLSEEPVKGFRELYERLDLHWDQTVEEVILRTSTDERRKEVSTYLHRTVRRDSRAARWTWRQRLTPDEQHRVRKGTAEVAAAFYGDEDWAGGP